jgi:hypothetical protein
MLLVELLQLMIKTIGIYILCVIIIISIANRQNNGLNVFLVMVNLLHRFYIKEFLAIIAPDFSYNNKNTAILEIADTFQDQIKRNSSDARIKMFGDIDVTAGWLLN